MANKSHWKSRSMRLSRRRISNGISNGISNETNNKSMSPRNGHRKSPGSRRRSRRGSRRSRRGSRRSRRGSRRRSRGGSRRGSRRGSRGGSRQGSRRRSRRRSRRGSRGGSRQGSRRGSRVRSRRGSRGGNSRRLRGGNMDNLPIMTKVTANVSSGCYGGDMGRERTGYIVRRILSEGDRPAGYILLVTKTPAVSHDLKEFAQAIAKNDSFYNINFGNKELAFTTANHISNFEIPRKQDLSQFETPEGSPLFPSSGQRFKKRSQFVFDPTPPGRAGREFVNASPGLFDITPSPERSPFIPSSGPKRRSPFIYAPISDPLQNPRRDTPDILYPLESRSFKRASPGLFDASPSALEDMYAAIIQSSGSLNTPISARTPSSQPFSTPSSGSLHTPISARTPSSQPFSTPSSGSLHTPISARTPSSQPFSTPSSGSLHTPDIESTPWHNPRIQPYPSSAPSVMKSKHAKYSPQRKLQSPYPRRKGFKTLQPEYVSNNPLQRRSRRYKR